MKTMGLDLWVDELNWDNPRTALLALARNVEVATNGILTADIHINWDSEPDIEFVVMSKDKKRISLFEVTFGVDNENNGIFLDSPYPSLVFAPGMNHKGFVCSWGQLESFVKEALCSRILVDFYNQAMKESFNNNRKLDLWVDGLDWYNKPLEALRILAGNIGYETKGKIDAAIDTSKELSPFCFWLSSKERRLPLFEILFMEYVVSYPAVIYSPCFDEQFNIVKSPNELANAVRGFLCSSLLATFYNQTMEEVFNDNDSRELGLWVKDLDWENPKGALLTLCRNMSDATNGYFTATPYVNIEGGIKSIRIYIKSKSVKTWLLQALFLTECKTVIDSPFFKKEKTVYSPKGIADTIKDILNSEQLSSIYNEAMSSKLETPEVTILPKGTNVFSLSPTELLNVSALHLRESLPSSRDEIMWIESYEDETADEFWVNGLKRDGDRLYTGCVLKCLYFDINQDYPVAVRYELEKEETHCIAHNGSELLNILQETIELRIGIKFTEFQP